MTVNPGFGGQAFIDMTDKVRRLRALIGDRPIHIEIDGGITPDTAPIMARAGAGCVWSQALPCSRVGRFTDPAPYGANIRAIRAAAESVTGAVV